MKRSRLLHKHELIGLDVEIIESASKTLIGLKGIVVDETKNTIVIEVRNMEKRIPKHGTTFRFHVDGSKDVVGDRLLHRPEDRTKRAR